ncbi:MAG: aminotransferase class IV [Candidatus Flexifilum sp.]|jgi:branched-chain amino acid aminotransferase
MPCIVRILTPEGLHPAPYTADSLADAAQYEPHHGVYTITNTFQTTRVLKLSAHLDRMEDSARREGIPLQLNRPRLRAALRSLILESGWENVRFRITVPAEHPEQIILSLEPFRPLSAEVYERGVKLITLDHAVRQHPEAKTTDWMQDRVRFEQALPPGIFTGLLVDEQGFILEGLSSNFYAILDGELRTAGSGVLPGIAQQIVFEIAPPIIPLRRDPVHVTDIPQLSEAFITSSSRGIVPAVEINGQSIGNGAPGPITQALRAAYAEAIAPLLEEL